MLLLICCFLSTSTVSSNAVNSSVTQPAHHPGTPRGGQPIPPIPYQGGAAYSSVSVEHNLDSTSNHPTTTTTTEDASPAPPSPTPTPPRHHAPRPQHRQHRGPLDHLGQLDLLLRNYDRRSTPTSLSGVATDVSCQFYIASMGSINTEDMDYTTDLYLKNRWTDDRLSDPGREEPLDLADPNLVKAIWKPEVFFPNAKEGDFQFVTMPNLLIRIHPDGQILYILRLKLKFSCMMELSRYPLDKQACGMMISSFSKTTREMILTWSKTEEAVTVAKDLKMPQFTLEKVVAKQCEDYNHMGNYSCLVAKFFMRRSISFHLIQNYLPSMLMVGISWVSFWMDIESVPGRISLGVITLLSISNQASGTNVPQTSYVKAIDIWMGTCTAFVFAALVEFTFVNYTWRTRGKIVHKTSTAAKCKGYENGEKLIPVEADNPRLEDNIGKAISSANCWRKFATGIDEVSRILFPLGFAVFNIIYWVYYLIIAQDHEDDLLGEYANSTYILE